MLEFVRKLNRNVYSYRVILPFAIASGWASRGVTRVKITYDQLEDCVILKPIAGDEKSGGEGE